MRAFIKSLLSGLACVLLASCGGGGGSGNNTAFEPAGLVVSVSPATVNTTPGSVIGVTVTARNSNGAPVVDGTQVTLRASPPGIGLVSRADAAGTAVTLGETATASTSGGLANFRFHARSLGTATLTGSVADNGRSISGTASVNVAAGPSNDSRLTVSVQNATIPQSPFIGLATVYPGSPYATQITVTQRHLDGSVVNQAGTSTTSDFCAAATGTGGGASIGNGQTVALWLPAEGIDNSVTPPQIRLCRSITYGFNSGVAIFYAVSFEGTGPTTVTVSATDPDTGENLSAAVVINVTNGTANLPGSLIINDVNDLPVYVQGTNGLQSKNMQVYVYDGAVSLIPNPPPGVNNVQLEIVGGPQGGERLTGVSATGANQTGGSISVRTFAGIASFSYQSGTRQGIVTVRATADRADNNVDNGITDPVVTTRGFAVSDGKLFDLALTSPTVNAIFVNGGGDGVSVDLPNGQTITIPLAPDGTYTLTVSALCTDRFGNPCTPGTEIRFGMIDYPKVPGGGLFALRGGDGDPQEGGTLFTAPSGAFTTAGGGAGPGDTLIVFGRDVPGNRDLESARTVTAVNSATSLTVQNRFNLNDDTGVSVNNGPVLPYVIGRATSGNIQVSAQTNALGVATTELTYPVSKVGTVAVVWAQGSGPVVAGLGGNAKLVTDAQFIRFAGVAPGLLTATPSTIPGNTTFPVQVCLTDALGTGISEVPISFSFTDLSGTGSVNGVTGGGVIPQLTGSDGCVTANVTTSGVTQPGTGGSTPAVVFSAGGLSASVSIVVSGQILQANPSAFQGDGIATIKLKLIDSSGAPVNGVQLTVACTSTGGALTTVTQPGVTGQPQPGVSPQNGPGETTAVIDAIGFETCGTPPTGQCVFSTASGSPSATVTFRGVDLANFSPPPPSCGP